MNKIFPLVAPPTSQDFVLENLSVFSVFWGTFQPVSCFVVVRFWFFFLCVWFLAPLFPPPRKWGKAPLPPPPLDPRLDSCIAYHNLIVWRWRLFSHTWDYLYVVSHRIVFVVHRCNWTYSTARHPHGTRTAPAQHPHGTRTAPARRTCKPWGARTIAARRPAIDLTDALRLNSSNFWRAPHGRRRICDHTRRRN